MAECITDSWPIRGDAGGGVSMRGAKKLCHVVQEMAEAPVQAGGEYGVEIWANVIRQTALRNPTHVHTRD